MKPRNEKWQYFSNGSQGIDNLNSYMVNEIFFSFLLLNMSWAGLNLSGGQSCSAGRSFPSLIYMLTLVIIFIVSKDTLAIIIMIHVSVLFIFNLVELFKYHISKKSSRPFVHLIW